MGRTKLLRLETTIDGRPLKDRIIQGLQRVSEKDIKTVDGWTRKQKREYMRVNKKIETKRRQML
jgi:hypothetical protein